MRVRTAFIAFAGIVAAGSLAQADILAGPVTNPVNGHDYYLLTHSSWTDSQTEAVSLGGALVTINDAGEETFVLNAFLSYGELWIGLTDLDVEGDFEWISGEPVTYLNWRPGEPNGGQGDNYVHIWNDGSGWNDTSDTYPYPFGVVEVVPEPTSVVLLGFAALFTYRRRSIVSASG